MKKLIRSVLILAAAAAALYPLGVLADDAKAILGVWSGGMPGDPPGSIEL